MSELTLESGARAPLKISGTSASERDSMFGGLAQSDLVNAEKRVTEAVRTGGYPGIKVGDSTISPNGLLEVKLVRADGETQPIYFTRHRLGDPEVVSALVHNAARLLEIAPPKAPTPPPPESPAPAGPEQTQATKDALGFVKSLSEFVRSDEYKRSSDRQGLLRQFMERTKPPAFDLPLDFAETVHAVIASPFYSGSKGPDKMDDLPYHAKSAVISWLFSSISGKEGFTPELLAQASYSVLLMKDPERYTSKKFLDKKGEPDVKKVLVDYFFHHRREANMLKRLMAGDKEGKKAAANDTEFEEGEKA